MAVPRFLEAVLGGLAVASAAAAAQEREPVEAVPAAAPAKEPVPPRWFVTGEEVELVDLLDACAAGLDLALDYDRAQVQGKVTIRSDLGFSDEGVWSLANRVLLSRKLASVQAPGELALGIVPVSEAAKVARIERDVHAARAGFVKVLERLDHADPEKVAEPLRAVLGSEGCLIQPIKDARQVLLAGPKPQVIEALDLIDLLDSPVPPVVEAFRVRHATPTAVVALLERVTKAIEQVGKYRPEGVALAEPASGTILVVAPEAEIPWWRDQVARFDQVQPSVTRNYVPSRFSLKETARLVEEVARGPVEAAGSWRMVEDELTGTLVITATPAQHDEVERVMVRLENEPPDSRIALRAFPIRHRDVDEFLGLLENRGQRLGQALRVAPRARLDRDGHHRTAVHVDRVLDLVREVRAPVLQLGDLGVGIVGVLPVVVGGLVLALLVDAREIRASRGLDARLLRQRLEEGVVALAAVAAHDALHRRVGFHRRRVDAPRLALEEARLGQHLQHEGEDLLVRFEVQALADPAQTRVVRSLLRQVVAEEGAASTTRPATPRMTGS